MDQPRIESGFERAEDRAWSNGRFLAFTGEAGQRLTRRHHLGDLRIESSDPDRRHLPSLLPVIQCIEFEQLSNLFEGEAGPLCRSNKLERPDVVIVVAPEPFLPGGFSQQAAALIEAYGLDADIGRLGEFRDRQRNGLDSVLWYGSYMGRDRMSSRRALS
jgi:hypothetical protein